MKGFAVWPFDSTGKDVATLLGPEPAPWLERAEVIAWAPDPNAKPLRYFVVAKLPRDEFATWCHTLNLSMAATPNTPSGVWVLPSEIKPTHWIDPAAAGKELIDASGTTARATLWARWLDGRVYMVLYPSE